jgi:putative transposase
VLLRRDGWHVNAKRIYRLYAEEGLIVRTKQRRKIARRQRVAAPMAAGANQRWSMDFVSDKLADGRSFRILTVVDQFTRECVGLEAGRAMTGMKVAQAMEGRGRNEEACRRASPWTMAACAVKSVDRVLDEWPAGLADRPS